MLYRIAGNEISGGSHREESQEQAKQVVLARGVRGPDGRFGYCGRGRASELELTFPEHPSEDGIGGEGRG